jgi:hypothetical protein
MRGAPHPLGLRRQWQFEWQFRGADEGESVPNDRNPASKVRNALSKPQITGCKLGHLKLIRECAFG